MVRSQELALRVCFEVVKFQDLDMWGEIPALASATVVTAIALRLTNCLLEYPDSIHESYVVFN